MVAKKTAKRKPIIKRAKTVQKAKGKGQNININIDQSKRTSRKTISQPPLRQQVVSTFTPTMAPPPPSYIPFPFPTPNLNPFESAVRETQKAKLKEEPNELEKPKKQTSEGTAQTDDIPEATIISNFNMPPPIQFVESFPVVEETPIVKAIQIKSPLKKKESPVGIDQDLQQYKRILKKYNEKQQPDLSESVWFNPSRETRTPIEDQNIMEQKKPQIMTIYQPKVREGGSNIITLSDLTREKKDVKELEQENRDYWQNLSSGAALGGPMERLNREELRVRRYQKMEEGLKKNKPAIFEPNVKKVINEPNQEEQINEELKEISLFKRYEKPKQPIILKNISYEEEMKEREKQLKRQEEEREKARRQYSNLSSDKTAQEIDQVKFARFLDENPGSTIVDYLERKKYLDKQEEKQKREIEENLRAWNERKAMKEEDLRTKKFEVIADESREGYKDPETIKREQEFDEFKKKLMKMKTNDLKRLAKNKGLKQPQHADKQVMVELILSNA